MSVSASSSLIFLPYSNWSITTVAFPLSAGAMTVVSCALRFFKALYSAGWRFEGGGLDLARRHAIIVLACCAKVEPDLLRLPSTEAPISGKGILLGSGANFKPLANAFSTAKRGLDDKLTTHLSVGCGHNVPTADCYHKVSNFIFC